MNTEELLDLLLNTGKELSEKGKTLIEAKLGLPEDPRQREAVLSSAGKGAVAASVLALLLGTRTGRSLTGASLKLGSLAAVGTLAYQAYQNWQEQQMAAGQISDQPVAELSSQQREHKSRILLKAMIAAARADGHIDQQEKDLISEQAAKLSFDSEVGDIIVAQINKPLSIPDVISGIDSMELASEVYLLSRLIIDADNIEERRYLEQLATALKLPQELVDELDQQIH